MEKARKKQPDRFDQAARYAAKLDPPGFCRRLLPDSAADWKFVRWLDTRTLPFPGEPDRTCDTVAEFAREDERDRPTAVVLEFMTEPRAEALERLGEYLFRARRELRPVPGSGGRYEAVAVLVNLTGPTQPD